MTVLADAVRAIEEVATARLLAGDPNQAARLRELARLLGEEYEVLDGIERFGLPVVAVDYPPGAALGYLLRHCAATRRIRQLRGLPEAEVASGDR